MQLGRLPLCQLSYSRPVGARTESITDVKAPLRRLGSSTAHRQRDNFRCVLVRIESVVEIRPQERRLFPDTEDAYHYRLAPRSTCDSCWPSRAAGPA